MTILNMAPTGNQDSRVLETKSHSGYGIWELNPYSFGTWTPGYERLRRFSEHVGSLP